MRSLRKSLTSGQAARLTAETEPWMSCDDCFHLMDQHVDALLNHSGGNPSLPEPFRRHLDNCPACFEEVEGLLCLTASDRGLSERIASKSIRAAVQARPTRSWRTLKKSHKRG